MCTVAKYVKAFDAPDVRTPLDEKKYSTGRKFREVGVLWRKFDSAKCNSTSCSRRFILSKVSPRENLLSFCCRGEIIICYNV